MKISYALEVATLLGLCTDIKAPWIFECKATANSKAAVTNLIVIGDDHYEMEAGKNF